MWITLLTRYWQLALIGVLLIALGAFRFEVQHLSHELDVAHAQLALEAQLGKTQAARAADIAKQQKELNDAITVQLAAEQVAHRAVSDELARRLRQWANARPSPVPAPAGPAPGSDGPPGGSGRPEAPGEVLGDLATACDADAVRFEALQRWAATLRH